MDAKKREEFKLKLLQLKSKIINGRTLRELTDLQTSSDDLADEADLATNVINQAVTFGLRKQELAKLHQIEQALERVNNLTFGHCEDCDEPISLIRLEKQPWANLCILHAEEREKENVTFLRKAA